jgi:putative redox protein
MVVTSTLVTVSETGRSPFSVQIAMGDFMLTGDEPLSQGGGELGPSPFQLMCAALAECTAMTVRWFARQQKWPLDHVEVTVQHRRGRVEGAPHNLELFEKTVSLFGEALSEEQRAQLLSIAGKCPVQRALEGASRITTEPRCSGGSTNALQQAPTSLSTRLLS